LIAAEEPAVRGFLESLAPGLAVDLAAGTGRLARVLRSLGHEVVALDASEPMLREAKRDADGVRHVLADLRRLPVADGRADVVTCGLALTHVEEIEGPIGEIARVLRPGGVAVLSDVHPVAAATGAHAFFRREDGSRGATRNAIHWPSRYVSAFGRAGLRIEGCAEPTFDESFVREIPDGALRTAARVSLLDLPFALVWLVRRER
jgi:ubiquinone/menaquinone biosynthesis C-methylase UbiE